jgi:conjugative transfer signal peptidase TraF
MATRPSCPLLLWNASPSVPIGLYLRTARPADVGALALLRLPEPVRSLAAARGYLPAGVLLVKPVAAAAGDLVCRHGPLVAINARTVARAAHFDREGRPLPRWSGCRRLGTAQVFLLSPEPDSFDGRYFGPLQRRTLAGTALPVWTPRQTTVPGGVPPGEQRKRATPFGMTCEPIRCEASALWVARPWGIMLR